MKLMEEKAYKRLARAIEKLSQVNGYPPTLRELAAATGESFSTVHFRLKKMRRAGVVVYKSGVARTVRLVA